MERRAATHRVYFEKDDRGGQVVRDYVMDLGVEDPYLPGVVVNRLSPAVNPDGELVSLYGRSIDAPEEWYVYYTWLKLPPYTFTSGLVSRIEPIQYYRVQLSIKDPAIEYDLKMVRDKEFGQDCFKTVSGDVMRYNRSGERFSVHGEHGASSHEVTWSVVVPWGENEDSPPQPMWVRITLDGKEPFVLKMYTTELSDSLVARDGTRVARLSDLGTRFRDFDGKIYMRVERGGILNTEIRPWTDADDATAGIKFSRGKIRFSDLPKGLIPRLLEAMQQGTRVGLEDALDLAKILDSVSLLQKGVVADLLRLLEIGAKKYGPENWKSVPNARVEYYNGLCRHLSKWWDEGEWFDKENKIHHLIAVIWNAACLYWFDMNEAKKETDVDIHSA